MHDWFFWIGAAVVFALSGLPFLAAAWEGRQRTRQEAQWHARFVHGVYEYQEHEDGRRRAVRVISNGECPLLDEWLRDGRSVEV